MIATIEGEIRGISQIVRNGKTMNLALVEQKTKGIPITSIINLKSNNRKEGEKVSMKVFISAGLDRKNKVQLWVNEV